MAEEKAVEAVQTEARVEFPAAEKQAMEAPKAEPKAAAPAVAHAEAKEAGKAAAAAKPKKKRAKRKGILVKAKKKESIARATIRKGTGAIHINKRNLELVEPLLVKRLIKEPVLLAGPAAAEVDIDVNVHGGGFMGQAVSARAAIAKALIEYTQNDKLKNAYLKYDRMLLVDDTRRVEPKKPLGPKARRKKQKSKR